MRRSFLYRGFTLLEIMVVVAIIGILTVAVATNLGRSSTVSRNAERQNDLRNLQTALETYKNENGRYPAQCPTSGASANGWSGQVGTNYECTGGSRDYIVGLAPDFISKLPVDPKLPSGRTDVGYVYRTNAEGSVYKIMAMNTVENDPGLDDGSASNLIAYTHPMKSCDITARIVDTTGLPDTRQSARSLCYVFSTGINSVSGVISQCESTNSRYKTSYALWGGYAALLTTAPDNDPNLTNAERYALKNTSDVICQ